ncbi:hypothetical protein ACFYKX_01425 [Cytobacillus sp. FJAT-54145]|uniref:Uncharacterized protein n=1 Tax=Cytobacillus spartinae TaxID=3299023 RepID=A0ABW6K7M1_9BACI
MNTKLIIVEGLPGFGKSTTANFIRDLLEEKGIKNQLFLEGNLDHPADYDGVSCHTEAELQHLLSNHLEVKDILQNNVVEKGDKYFLPYQKMKNEYGSKLSTELFNEIFKKDIYELALDQNINLIVDKWTEFAQHALNENKTYIFECCFIQNPVTVGMIKYNASKEVVRDYVHRLQEVIKGLDPLLIYVEQDDLEFSFKKAIQERPQEWSEGFVNYYTNQGYGKAKGYKGIEGTIKVLEARRLLEEEIYDSLGIKKVKINNSNYEGKNYKQTLSDVLMCNFYK